MATKFCLFLHDRLLLGKNRKVSCTRFFITFSENKIRPPSCSCSLKASNVNLIVPQESQVKQDLSNLHYNIFIAISACDDNNEYAVLAYLAKFKNAFPSYETIAHHCNIGRTTVYRILKRLKVKLMISCRVEYDRAKKRKKVFYKVNHMITRALGLANQENKNNTTYQPKFKRDKNFDAPLKFQNGTVDSKIQEPLIGSTAKKAKALGYSDETIERALRLEKRKAKTAQLKGLWPRE